VTAVQVAVKMMDVRFRGNRYAVLEITKLDSKSKMKRVCFTVGEVSKAEQRAKRMEEADWQVLEQVEGVLTGGEAG
jgi:hypothetical protein